MKMGYLITPIFLIIGCLALNAQASGNLTDQTEDSELEEKIAQWIGNIYAFGVDVHADSLVVTAEVQEILHNEELRQFMYPETYDWKTTTFLLDKMELKKAFWFLINLHRQEEHRELVMKVILKYDTLLEMDIALMGAFYTYGMLDPEVSEINEDGQLEIKRPDIIESKLRTVKEMVDYLLKYRSYLKAKQE